MFRIIEIVIIAIAGAAAIGFFIWYFVNEIKGRKACASCAVKGFCLESKTKQESKRVKKD
jgi:hypothetical protein